MHAYMHLQPFYTKCHQVISHASWTSAGFAAEQLQIILDLQHQISSDDMHACMQAEEFEQVVGSVFRDAPPVPCWYPGAKERYQKFLIDHRGYELVPARGETDVTFSTPLLPHSARLDPRLQSTCPPSVSSFSTRYHRFQKSKF